MLTATAEKTQVKSGATSNVDDPILESIRNHCVGDHLSLFAKHNFEINGMQ